MATSETKPPRSFDFEAENLKKEWGGWLQNFTIFLIASKTVEQAFTKYDEVVEAFTSYFAPKKNLIHERCKFNKKCFNPGQLLIEFITELKTAAATCEFLERNEIRDRLVSQISDRHLLNKMLDEGENLTSERAIELCKRFEMRKQEIIDFSKNEDQNVDALRKKGSHQKDDTKTPRKVGTDGEDEVYSSDTGNMMVTSSPRFVTKGQNYRVVIGDTLVLPCEVENLGSYVLLWRRGASVLTADKIMVTRDTRFRLVDGFNLEIGNVAPQDAGDYVCQIGDGDNRDQIHTVEILVPPSIRTSPAGGQLTARKGGTITLECKASGNPVPTISWSRKDHSMSTSDKAGEGFSITLEKVDRHQAGVYQCTAQNGVGDPITVDMTLDVLYPPEIEVERSWVHSGEGYEAQLVCIVHGEPAPNVVWYQDSFIMEPTERKTMETRGNKHSLNIKHVQSTDFGNYSCVAENNLGRAKKYMELSGRPSPAQFRSTPYSKNKDSYNLTWMVESYPPLEEVRLLYRKIMMNDTHQKHGKWHEVILHPNNGDTFTHLMSYNIRNLEAASVFEAIAQAKNRYGWNEVSDLYQFYTRGPARSDWWGSVLLGVSLLIYSRPVVSDHFESKDKCFCETDSMEQRNTITFYDYPSEPSLEDMELVAATSSQPSVCFSTTMMAVAAAVVML